MTSNLGGECNDVVLICPDFYPTNCGYANATTNFARAIARHSDRTIRIIVPARAETGRPKETIEDGRVEITRIGRVPLRFLGGWVDGLVNELRLGFVIRSFLRRHDYGFALFETLEQPIARWIALLGLPSSLKRKVAIRIHAVSDTEGFTYPTCITDWVRGIFARRVLRGVPNVSATTAFYLNYTTTKWLRENVFRTFKNYGVIPNVVESPPRVERQAGADLHLLTLGRLNSTGYNQKNFELVAHAMYLMRTADPALFSRVTVTAIGDGTRYQDFVGILEKLNLMARFRLHRRLPHDEVRRLQASCSAAVLVSRYEGQSMFALEALATGAPLIVADGTGISDLVVDGHNGFHVNASDPYSLLSALQRLGSSDIAALSKASAALFAARFEAHNTVSRLLDYMTFCKCSCK